MNDVNWKMFIAPILILFLFIGGIIGIVNWQRSKQEAAPQTSLSINLPEGPIETTEKEINVNGKVEKGDKVFVNNEEVPVEDDGSFSKNVALKEGENKLAVKSERDGKVVDSVERDVKYTATQAPTQFETPTPQVPQGSPAALQPAEKAPTAGPAEQPVAPGNLSSSGPEEVIIPVIGFGGIIVATVYYFRSRKQLATTLRHK